MKRLTQLSIACAVLAAGFVSTARADDVIAPASQRFAPADVAETPDFQRHTVPLLGKLGCNGRACHGSFQGRGGFRLSLFGYDFKMDHEGLSERIDTEDPAGSYALSKPTLSEPHEGGKRMEIGGWEYNLFLNWIKGGAKPRAEDAVDLVQLHVEPSEIRFSTDGQQQQLTAVAVWADGTREDVTCLCRFQTNDETIAAVEPTGLVSAGEAGDAHVVVFYDNAVVPVPVIRPVSDKSGESYPVVATPTKVDELVVDKLRKVGLVPSDVCDDAEFLRRVSLDIAGTLPTAAEVRAFLADTTADKRERKINELLETPAYAAWWTTKFCDWTGNSDQVLNNVNVALGNQGAVSRQWYDWINKRVAENVAYDDLVEGIVVARDRQADESYREYCERMSAKYHGEQQGSYADEPGLTYFWARSNFNNAENRALGFAYTFTGIRIQCAQCHKHPFDQWTQQDFEQFEQFFTRINFSRNGSDRGEYNALLKELGLEGNRNGNEIRRGIAQALQDGKVVPFPELVVSRPGANNRRRGRNQDARPEQNMARLLGGETVNLAEIEDPRTALMDWLRHDEKQLFAKAFVNRAWANYFNRGIVDPTDDLSLANPPTNAPLLDYLAKGFVENEYDMKWVHRTICNSETYQRSWRPNETNAGDERNFSRAVPRRLPAEMAYDALVMATVEDSRAATFVTELQGRALTLPGVPRGNGRNTGPNYALTIFGRSLRENNCDCERSSEASLLQTVFLRNDQETLQMIDRRDGWISQIADELAGRARDAEPAEQGRDRNRDRQNNDRASIADMIQNAEAALARAKESGDKERIERIEARLKAAREQARRNRGSDRNAESQPQQDKPAAAPDAKADVPRLVEEAYLRTVNRLPSDNERQIAAAFITDADEPIEGLRGLLWSLINTKEFIVNH
jgi:hypothetical protein